MTSFLVEDLVFEGADAYNDGAIVRGSNSSDDGTLITTSDVSGSIVFDIFPEGSATAVYSTTLTASSVISNSPVPWRLDSIGRNFRHKVRQIDVAAGTLKGGRRYRMVYRIPTSSDGTLVCIWVWKIAPVEA